MSAIRRKFTRSNGPLLPYMLPDQQPVCILFDGVVHKTDAVFQSWSFSDLVTRLNPLHRLRSVVNAKRRPTSDEGGVTSNGLFGVEDKNHSSTQASAQASFQRVRLL